MYSTVILQTSIKRGVKIILISTGKNIVKNIGIKSNRGAQLGLRLDQKLQRIKDEVQTSFRPHGETQKHPVTHVSAIAVLSYSNI